MEDQKKQYGALKNSQFKGKSILSNFLKNTETLSKKLVDQLAAS